MKIYEGLNNIMMFCFTLEHRRKHPALLFLDRRQTNF